MNLGGGARARRVGNDVRSAALLVSPDADQASMPAGIQDGDAQIIVEANGV